MATAQPRAGPQQQQQQLLQLLELPLPWLTQLCDHLGAQRAAAALFATCRTFRDLVLSSTAQRTGLNISVYCDTRNNVDMAHRALKLAARVCTYPYHVRMHLPNTLDGGSCAAALCLMSVEDGRRQQQQQQQQQQEQQGNGKGGSSGGEEALAKKQSPALAMAEIVTLSPMPEATEDLTLHELVPSYLIPACTEFAVLNLTCIHMEQLPSANCHVPICHQLRRINISNSTLHVDVEAFKNQLRAVPNVTAMTISYNDWPNWCECIGGLGTQLVNLIMRGMAIPLPIARKLDTFFPVMVSLQLQGLEVDDDVLATIMRMQRLSDLQVQRFALQQDHTHQQWGIQQVSIFEADVASLARLPIPTHHQCQLVLDYNLAVRDTMVLLLPDAGSEQQDVQLVSTAVQQAALLGGLHLPSTNIMTHSTLDVCCVEGMGIVHPAAVQAALPLLPHDVQGHVNLCRVRPVTRELAVALGQQLKHTACITFDDCSWGPHALGSLLNTCTSAAAVHTVGIYWWAPECGLDEAQLLAACMAGPRAVTLRICGPGLPAGCEKRVRAALEAAGKGHVQLSVLPADE